MNFEELLDVLRRTNKERGGLVDDDLLKEIVALVMKNPLDEDRAQCQEQISLVVAQKSGGRRGAD